MSTITSQNWDGVTAPATPAGWTLTNATTNVSGRSTLNSLRVVDPSAGSGAVFNTTDTANGNVVAQTAVWFEGSNQSWVFARAGNNAPIPNNSYFLDLDKGGAHLQLRVYISGSPTTLATVACTLSLSVWYILTLTCNGTTITGQVQRDSDGFYLNAAGTFVSGVQTAISVTDANLQGSGLYGFGTFGGTSRFDDFLATTIPVVPSAASVTFLPVNTTQTVPIVGTGTSWTGSTTFSLSGGTGASISSQSISGQAGTLTIVAGSAAGILTITNNTDGLSVPIGVGVAPTGEVELLPSPNGGLVSSTALVIGSIVHNAALLQDTGVDDFWASSVNPSTVTYDLGAGINCVLTRLRLMSRPETWSGSTATLHMAETNGAVLTGTPDGGSPGTLVSVPTPSTAAGFYLAHHWYDLVSDPTACRTLLLTLAAAGGLSKIRLIGSYTAPVSVAPVVPTVSPGGGWYSGSQTVVFGSITANAQVIYTTDGSQPTAAHGTQVAQGAGVALTSVMGDSDGNVTVKAVAVLPSTGVLSTDSLTAIYHIPAAYIPGGVMADIAGRPINSHDACIVADGFGTYHMFAQSVNTIQAPPQNANPRMPVTHYSSTDLKNWTELDTLPKLATGTGAQRPHVLFCAPTGKWVMWVDDGPGAASIATASSLGGPWTWVHQNTFPDGSTFLDCCLFVDPADGTAWSVYNGVGATAGTGILATQLTPSDFSTVVAGSTILLDNRGNRESPVLWAANGRVYFLTSANNGYSQTSFDCKSAPSFRGASNSIQSQKAVLGASPWAAGVAGVTNGVFAPTLKYGVQPSAALTLTDRTGTVLIADHWVLANLPASVPVFMPIKYSADLTNVQLQAADMASWDLSTFPSLVTHEAARNRSVSFSSRRAS